MTSFIRDFKIYPDAAIDENVTPKYHELCSVVSLSQLFHLAVHIVQCGVSKKTRIKSGRTVSELLYLKM